MEEGASTAGDHVEGLANHAPLVVMKVAAEIEHAVRLEGEVTASSMACPTGLGSPKDSAGSGARKTSRSPGRSARRSMKNVR